jgi:hypothetical protein
MLFFWQTPRLGLASLLVVAALTPVTVSAVVAGGNAKAASAVAALFAVPVVLAVYVPFLALLSAVVRGAYRCENVPAWYVVYLFFALQAAHAHLAFATYVGNEQRSYTGVCGSFDACSVADTPYWVFFRFVYYAATTFVTAGYGDIAPLNFWGTAWVLPLLWSPVFFLGILLGKIIGQAPPPPP